MNILFTKEKIKKVLFFTDIHFGRRNNSLEHNEDCVNFIQWMVNIIKNDTSINCVIFNGDWFENRNAINIKTIDTSIEAIHILNDLNIPVYIIVGNHDLYHRENRSVYASRIFNEFNNIHVISEITKLNDSFLLVPFLFKEEYPLLVKYNNIKYFTGHFEFKGFVLSGTDRIAEHGPEHNMFNTQKYIFSGHFHKRQIKDNVIYVGNTFPMDFSDSFDENRGICILNCDNDEVIFKNWEHSPKYRKVKLSNIIDSNVDFNNKTRVHCLIDLDISYSEVQELKDHFIKTYNLREFTLEEMTKEQKEIINGDDIDNNETIENNLSLLNINDGIIDMLKNNIPQNVSIDRDVLISIYEDLK